MAQADIEASEKTYRAIGRFIFKFSQVEYTVRHYIAMEIDIKDEYFTPVMESYDVALLISIAKEVYKKARAGYEDRIWKLLKKFNRMNDERKRVAHGLWVPFVKGGTVHYVSRNKLSTAQFSDQAAHLERLADELCQLRADLERAFCDMHPSLKQP